MEPPDRRSYDAEVEAPLLDYRQKDDVGLHDRPTTVEMVEEAKLQLELGVPVVLMCLLDYLVQIISVMFVGHLGALYLAGAAMAASFANVTGFAVLEGLAGGMETSGGQAHGAGQPQLLGLLLQRGQLVLLSFSIPISFLWLCAPSILRLWGQDPTIADLSGEYVICLIPGLLASSCYLPVAKFLQVQGITVPLAAVSCTVLALHAPVCWFYIYVLDLGFRGAALATSTSNLGTLILMVLYLNFERSGILKRTWPGWSLAAFRNLGPFMALALPACTMTSFEWWVFEIIQIMAGWLPHPDINVSVMTISFQTVGVCFMLPLGLATASSIRVAHELGAQRPGRARWAVIVAIALATISGVALATILMVARKQWARLFTNPSETAVVQGVIGMVPVIAVSMLGVAWTAILSGVLRGSGQQVYASVVNTLALYGFSLPLAYMMGIRKQMGVQGLWRGMMMGVVLQILGQIFLTCRTNWEYQLQNRDHGLISNVHQPPHGTWAFRARRALSRVDENVVKSDKITS